MTIVTKIVDVFNIFVPAANFGQWIYIVLQATKAAQVWPVKLLKQRAFASVDILHGKCVRSITLNYTFHMTNFWYTRSLCNHLHVFCRVWRHPSVTQKYWDYWKECSFALNSEPTIYVCLLLQYRLHFPVLIDKLFLKNSGFLLPPCWQHFSTPKNHSAFSIFLHVFNEAYLYWL